MRGRKKGQQTIYTTTFVWVDIVDEHGDKTGEKKKVFSIDKTFEASVSTNENMPSTVSAGIVLDYDRTMTLFDRVELHEGDELFVDRVPLIEGETLKNSPDYIVKKDITMAKGMVFRYGIKKLV